MSNTPHSRKPATPAPASRPTPPASIRKYRTLGVPLLQESFAEFVALAAADQRAPGTLGRIAILDFLKQRRAALDPPAPEGKSL